MIHCETSFCVSTTGIIAERSRIRNSYLALAEDNWRFPANEAKYISLAPIFAC